MTRDAEILVALRRAGDRPVNGADLAQRLGMTRSALYHHIQELRGLGYEIDSSPHSGFQLRRAPDTLHADDLVARLGRTRIVGRDIRVFQETTSTNDIVEKLARDGVEEGAVVFAECQTKGRGRLGRRWVSPRGKGLWFSVLLRPPLAPESVTRLTIASAAALARAIRIQTGLRPEIKWPNDLLINRRKITGILTELSAELDRIRYVILGIGVDVNLAKSDFAPELREVATSLKIELGHAVDRSELAAVILRELDQDYVRVTGSGFEALADEWQSQCTTLGQDVTIRLGNRVVRGRAESIDSTGALLLRTGHGHLERICGGDLNLELDRK